MPVVYVIIGAASQNHMHVSWSENYKMLSNATGCPYCSKNLYRRVFNMLNPNFLSDLLSDHSSNTSFNEKKIKVAVSHYYLSFHFYIVAKTAKHRHVYMFQALPAIM